MRVPSVISRGIMCCSGAIVLMIEIDRLLFLIETWEENAHLVRVLNVIIPTDPVTDVEDLEYELGELTRWQYALTALVLQLAEIHSGFGILTYW